MRIAPASDSSIFISFGDTISAHYHAQVVALFRRVRALAHPHIRNVHPAYSSVLIDFDPLRLSHDTLRELIMTLLAKPPPDPDPASLVEISVCYDTAFAPDLEF